MNEWKRNSTRRWAAAALLIGVALGTAQAQSRRDADSAAPPTALQPDQFDASASVEVRQTGDGLYEIKIGDSTFRHAKWSEIEKKAMALLPGRTITFVDPAGKPLHVSPRAMIGILLEPIAGALASQLNVAPGDALVVTEVQAGLPADKAGLRLHDVIIECNGRRPMTNATFSKIIAAAVPGDTMNVVLVRQGRETEVEVRLERYDPVAMESIRQPMPTGLITEEILNWLREAGEALPEGIAVPQNGDHQPPVVSIRDPKIRSSDPNSEAIRAELDGIRKQLRRIEEVLTDLLLLEQQRQAAAARSVGG